MTTKCFNCQSVFDKKLEKGRSVLLAKTCPDCRKQAPRQSLRPMRSPKK